MKKLLIVAVLCLLVPSCTTVKMSSTGAKTDPKTGVVLTNYATAHMTALLGGKETIQALKATGGVTSSVGATGIEQGLDPQLSVILEAIIKAAISAAATAAKTP